LKSYGFPYSHGQPGNVTGAFGSCSALLGVSRLVATMRGDRHRLDAV